MADSITARTMFFETLNGHIRFYDWNKVETTLGTMMEPRQMIGFANGNLNNKFASFRWADQCAKITNMVCANIRDLDALLSDGQKITVGGTHFPQDYDY